ncbi:MAG: FAD-dependent oxidoreductase, partial [Burkholderiales bacterium]
MNGPESDAIVVGGGLVGAAIAWGLAGLGERVRLLDEGDDALRAARGNFGLVWVQGKGATCPPYARWTMRSAAAWPALATELADATGIDVELRQPGGLKFALDEEELAARARTRDTLAAALGGDYPVELLDAAATRRSCPAVGPRIAGASYCPLDGHVNPMKLLEALLVGVQRRGGVYTPLAPVRAIAWSGGVFRIEAGGCRYTAPTLVLAAGLGNRELAPRVGLDAPVRPNRGQILVTERVAPFLDRPTEFVRQTGEGVIQIGDSQEDAGLDDRTTRSEIARIASRAVRVFPRLAGVNVVRAWAALRVMTADGLPIYEASSRCPGAFVATCHSGVTLAAVHAGELARWVAGGARPPETAGFIAARFAAAGEGFA